jgi:hypothetical protein
VFEARLKTLLCERNIFAKSKEMKTGGSNCWKDMARNGHVWQNFLMRAVAKKGCFANGDSDNRGNYFRSFLKTNDE